MVRISDILDVFLQKCPEGDTTRIQRAYLFSAKKHEGQIRKSGEPYMIHPLAVARTIAEMGLDEASITAALLHDTVEDTGTTREEISKMFGDEIASLVDGVTKLSGINFSRKEERQAESFRKMLIAMSKDIRVLLLKLADRLHNMQTLGHMSPEGQERIAQETRDIYAPLANRLGIAWMKAELDDLAFKHLEPAAYEEIAAKVSGTRAERDAYIARTCDEIAQFLKAEGYEVRVTGRIKNLYSIHQKMVKKAIDFEQVYDAIAFRVICDTLANCYAILGMVHSRWVPLPGRFKDFIAIPKPNRYQSLHTTVVVGTGERIEIQIRTDEMHKIAEYGIAAHWTYKESKVSAPLVSAFTWLREMVESQDGVRDSEEFLDSVKVDLFTDEVFVFTPRGDIMSLPEGATPLDFAYAIHTEVGNHCAGARVGGVQVPLRHRLRSGDWVEIVTLKTQRPSSDWLDFVVTGRAQNKIRAYLRAEQLRQSRQVGHELLERALRRYGCSLAKITKTGALEKVAQDFKYGTVDNLLAALGSGKVEKADVVDRLLPEDKKSKPPPEVKEGAIEKVMRKVRGREEGIVLDGVEDLLVRFARCCNPLPGEQIIGFVTRGRGIVIHRRDCSRAKALDPERRTRVEWSPSAVAQRPMRLRVITVNRPGILTALSGIFTDLGINIASAHCEGDDTDRGSNIFTFTVKDLVQLNGLVRALKQSKGVQEVERLHD